MDKLVPKRRFKEFKDADAWEKRKLGDLAEFYDEKRIPIDSSKRKRGKIPYYGATGIIDYVDDYIFDGEYVLLAEDGANITMRNSPIAYLTQGRFWLNNHAHIIKMKNGSNFFLLQLLELQNYERFNSGTAQPKLNGQIVKGMVLNFPREREQCQIGNLFKNIDNTITLQQRKLDKLKNMKSALLYEMFPVGNEKKPRRRLAGFTDDWEQCKLGEVMNVTSVKRIHQSDWMASGIRFLRARDIVSFAKGEIPTDCLYISEEKYEEYSKISGKVEIGDLLVTGVGSIGVPYLIESKAPLYFKDGNIIWFKNKSFDGKFFYYSFTGKQIQSFIKNTSG
ncbi:MAG TPA: restriction endonuclease subunit S, partial [Candidatus Merdenecus merdavium]|nr:restriction endonuclease subunit S [Candidatus Merdenecus merdavium]